MGLEAILFNIYRGSLAIGQAVNLDSPPLVTGYDYEVMPNMEEATGFVLQTNRSLPSAKEKLTSFLCHAWFRFSETFSGRGESLSEKRQSLRKVHVDRLAVLNTFRAVYCFYRK
ncbi:hypothetical protein AVEN_52968-1 [Araneus ventricosus]|uniref:Uncharacterized protein n=1 Tax=Araneus ventricosus TaxID=182803 RepID=A0A4Y2JL68_ARAVE|nr:hypothetical protein AVEN_52968-1 [Araneus ventricosus]